MREKKGPVERGYRPLDPPELDVDLLSFVLPPAMDIDAGYQFERPPIDSKPILQLATFESAWSEDNANGEFLPEAKIGSMLFQVMMALIPENATPVNKAKDGGGRLPKEVRPRAPRLKPSPLPFTLEEVPEMSLPLAEDTDTDVYAELEQLKPMISFQEPAHAGRPGFLGWLHNAETLETSTALEKKLALDAEKRPRASTCSTCVTLSDFDGPRSKKEVEGCRLV
ncbi:unnamed protein product [Effrenium voratum]|nr:unnamed protein product [Effrenium voratum]